MSSSPFTCWSRLPAPTRACVKRTFRALVDQFERARVLSVKAHIQRSIRNPAMHDDAIEAFFCLMVKYASEHNTSDVVVEPYRHGAKTVLLRTSRVEGPWGPHIVLTFQVASSAEEVVARLTNLKTYNVLALWRCGHVRREGECAQFEPQAGLWPLPLRVLLQPRVPGRQLADTRAGLPPRAAAAEGQAVQTGGAVWRR